MKKIKILFFTLLASLFFTAASFAFSEKVMPNPEALLRAEITELIGQPDNWVWGKNKSLEANIQIVIDSDNKIVLIDSGTTNARLTKYMTKKLNNTKIETENIAKFQAYFLKVRFDK